MRALHTRIISGSSLRAAGATPGGGGRQLLLRRRFLVLRHHLPVQHAQLLERLVVGIDAESDDLHQDAGHGFAAQHGHDGSLEGMALDLGVGVFEILGYFFLGRQDPRRLRRRLG